MTLPAAAASSTPTAKTGAATRPIAAFGCVSAAAVLIAVEFGQGLIGFVQYFTHLPVILVAAHMLGAALTWTATLAVLWSLRTRPPVAPAPAAVAPHIAEEPARVTAS